MQIIDGRKIARDILEQVSVEVSKLSFRPIFCDVLIGDDAASKQYVAMKAKTAEKAGFEFRRAEFPKGIKTEEVILEIKKLNNEKNICGLIVQLPLPIGLGTQAVLNAIDPRIDVDCTGKANADLFYSGKPYLSYPTAQAVMAVLDSLSLDLTQKKFLVIGRGQLVGRPVNYLLSAKGYEVEAADGKTENIERAIMQADVVISATGHPKLITGQMVKPGAIVIDAGTSESEGGIVGDVDFDSTKEITGFVSPVPGGVGPVTVAMLLSNVLKVAQSILPLK